MKNTDTKEAVQYAVEKIQMIVEHYGLFFLHNRLDDIMVEYGVRCITKEGSGEWQADNFLLLHELRDAFEMVPDNEEE